MSKRVLLKLSGESFADSETNFGISPNILNRIANEISRASKDGIQIAIVVGGGNFLEEYMNLLKIWHKQMQTIWAC